MASAHHFNNVPDKKAANGSQKEAASPIQPSGSISVVKKTQGMFAAIPIGEIVPKVVTKTGNAPNWAEAEAAAPADNPCSRRPLIDLSSLAPQRTRLKGANKNKMPAVERKDNQKETEPTMRKSVKTSAIPANASEVGPSLRLEKIGRAHV